VRRLSDICRGLMVHIGSREDNATVASADAGAVRVFLAHAEAEKLFVGRVKDTLVTLSRSQRVRRATQPRPAPSLTVYYDKDNFSLARDVSLGTFVDEAAEADVLLLFVPLGGLVDGSFVAKELLAFLTKTVRHRTRHEPDPPALTPAEQSMAESRIRQLLIVDRHSALTWSAKKEGPAGLPIICRTGCLRECFETERPRLRANSSEPADIAVAALALAWAADPENVRSRAAERRRLLTAAAVGVGALVVSLLVAMTVYATREAATARVAQDSAEASAKSEREARATAQTSEQLAVAAASAERIARGEAEASASAEKREHERAEERARVAKAEAYGSAALSYSLRDPTLALRLAQKSLQESPNATAQLAVLRAFNSGSWLYSERFDKAHDAVLSEDGSALAWRDTDSQVHVRRRGRHEMHWKVGSGEVALTRLGNLALASSGDLTVWTAGSGAGTLSIWNANGKKEATFNGRFLGAFPCGGDTLILADYSSSKDGGESQPIIRVVDVVARAEQTHPGPEDRSWGRIEDITCTPHAKRIVLCQERSVFVRRETGDYEAFSFASPYNAQDVDINSEGTYVVAFLRANRVGVQDGVGIIDLKAWSSRMIPLAEAPGDSGGSVSFIDDDRAIVASTAGWTRVINVKTGAVRSLPSKERGVDRIAVCPQTTAAKDGVRLWHRPQEPLVRAVDHADSFSNAPAASFMKLFEGAGVARACRDNRGFMRDGLSMDDAGLLSLCVRIAGREELLATGLTREDFTPVTATEEKDNQSVVIWNSGEYLRLFALEPTRVLSYLTSKEQLWAPSPAQLEASIR